MQYPLDRFRGEAAAAIFAKKRTKQKDENSKGKSAPQQFLFAVAFAEETDKQHTTGAINYCRIEPNGMMCTLNAATIHSAYR